MKPSSGKEPSFEEALEKLEVLVTQMESGEIPLEEMVRRFEDATRLLNSCTDRLQSAEQRLEALKKERRTVSFEQFNPDES